MARQVEVEMVKNGALKAKKKNCGGQVVLLRGLPAREFLL